MKLLRYLLLSVIFCSAIYCLDNGVGLTPAMGWNSWNHVHKNYIDKIIINL